MLVLWPSLSQGVRGKVVEILERYMPSLQDSSAARRGGVLLLVRILKVCRVEEISMYSVFIVQVFK